MFGSLGADAQKYVLNNYTTNLHNYGIVPSKFTSDAGLAAMYRPTSYSIDPANT